MVSLATRRCTSGGRRGLLGLAEQLARALGLSQAVVHGGQRGERDATLGAAHQGVSGQRLVQLVARPGEVARSLGQGGLHPGVLGAGVGVQEARPGLVQQALGAGQVVAPQRREGRGDAAQADGAVAQHGHDEHQHRRALRIMLRRERGVAETGDDEDEPELGRKHAVG